MDMNNIISEDKETVKKSINAFCNELYNLEYTGYINVPVVIILYLGDDSFKQVNASLEDAFTNAFSQPLPLTQMIIESDMTKDNLVDMIKNAIKEVSNQGKNFNDIRIGFITMMNDSFFDRTNHDLINEIAMTFEDLQYLGLNLSKRALYGLFDQNLMNINYQKAFLFINQGKQIWNNIYHLEIPFVAKDITSQTQLIALNMIRDKYLNKQNTLNDDYCWSSLYLNYLRIPEFITCRLLREIYGQQIDNKIDTSDLDESVNNVLDLLFEDLLNVNDQGIWQYVPLNYQETVTPKKKLSLSFFNKNKQDITPVYSHVLKDEHGMEELVKQLYAKITIDDNNYSKIIEKIISSAKVIDPNAANIGHQIIMILNRRQEQLDYQFSQLQEKQVSDNGIKNVNEYLRQEYQYYQKIISLIKEKDIIEQIKKNISNDMVLKQVIDEIVKVNHYYANLLDELALTEYGGTLEMLHIHNLPLFEVNLSIEEILKRIDKNFVNEIINNNQSLLQRLQLFLNHTLLNDIPYKHNLGIINKQYTNIKDIVSYLLLPTSLDNHIDIKDITSNYENLLKDVNDIYRNNSFYLISTRFYDSDKYIVNYKRGD